MDNIVSSNEKRQSVKRDYDLIAEQYSKEFGTYIEDLNVYEEFERYIFPNATILDLGAGSGRTYRYFNKKGYNYIGFDFSEKMKDYAYKIHGEFPYIVDDMVNIKDYFTKSSIDAIFAVYSLFHLPKDDFKKVISDIYDILKINGIFLFSYQLGEGENFVDEPYLEENGKGVLYMNYQTDNEMNNLLDSFEYKELYQKEKVETSVSAINNNKVITVFKILKKIK